MDYIKTTDILDPSIAMPWTGPMIDFLLNVGTQTRKAFAYSVLSEVLYANSQLTGVVLAGGTKSGSGNTMFNGWIFYKDELYFFPGAMGLLAFSNVPVFVLDETNDVGVGQVKFSDNVMRYVTKVRRLKVVDQVSGSGLFDMSTMGRIISDTVVTPGNYTHAAGIIVDIPGATFTSPNRVCDLDIEFHYDFRMIQLASNAVQVNVEMFGPGILKTNAHRMEGFGAAANQAITEHGVMRYTYRNCPANQVIKMRYQDIFVGAAGEWSFGSMTITYKEILRPRMW